MSRTDLHDLLDEALKLRGTAPVETALKSLLVSAAPETHVLTIVANAGIHEVPSNYLRGDVYEASRGDWDATTEDALAAELRTILLRLVTKLRSRRWGRIYLVPTGHPILSLQIKAMVYRILRLNTIDLYYKGGTYFEIDIDQRAIALAGEDRA